MESKSYTFTMKALDRVLWTRVKAKAAAEQVTMKALIERLLRAWLAGEVRL